MKEAIPLYESELADLEKLRGPDNAQTLRARRNLAAAFHKAKRLPDAIKLGEQTLADCEQLLGPGHWETLTTRANLAHAYHAAGQLKRSSAQFDRALRDCERALGPDDDLTEAGPGPAQALPGRTAGPRADHLPAGGVTAVVIMPI